LPGALSDKTMELLNGSDYQSGCTGSQLYVSAYGQPIIDVAVGHRDAANDMTSSTRATWLCCSKPVLLIALVEALAEAGASEHDPVARFVPEFADAGKGDVTLYHLFTHTVPYKSLGMTWTEDAVRGNDESEVAAASWEDALRAICGMSLFTRPGEVVTYTTMSSWHVLAEILQRLTGRQYDEVIGERVLDPLSMDCTSMCLTEQSLGAIRFAPLMVPVGEGWRTADLDTAPLAFARWPGLGCRGPARDMARPVECIAGWLEPTRIDPSWRVKLLEPCRTDLPDPIFLGAEVMWSLGLCADPMCYGLPPSKRVIGYTGARSSMVFADLDTGITVSFISNGMVPKERDWQRKRILVRAVYDELGLTLAGS
jgi:CubicO group peptidase (beta-lactamase class C family)